MYCRLDKKHRYGLSSRCSLPGFRQSIRQGSQKTPTGKAMALWNSWWPPEVDRSLPHWQIISGLRQECVSEQFPVDSGVPGGSTHGPRLFLLYTFDLPSVTTSKCSFIADDTKIYANPLDPHCSLQNDIISIQKWCDDWLLPLNVNKCWVLHIGKNNPRIRYSVAGSPITAVESQNDLGVVISSDLTWSNHIQYVSGRANRTLYLISKAFPNCSLNNLGLFYKTYIRPVLEYAGPVWHPALQKDINLLENIQRKASRLTLGQNRPSYEDRKLSCGLTNFM